MAQIRMLKPFKGYGEDTLQDFGATENGRLVSIGFASSDLDGPDGESVQRQANLAAELAAMVGSPRRRLMYPVNLLSPTAAPGKTETQGTVTASGANPSARVVDFVATSSGSTARIMAGWTLAVETAKIYEWSVQVDVAYFQNPGAMTKQWLSGAGLAANLNMISTPPVAGNRYAIRFQPAATSVIMRVGIGVDLAETVVSGDRLQVSDIQLCEVDSLTGSVTPFSYSELGASGKAKMTGDTLDSCVLFLGDSWANDATDYPGLVASKYNREIVVSAAGGHTLAQIYDLFATALSLGLASLHRPHFNIPGICVIEGGINDLVANRTSANMFADLMDIVAALRARNIVPIVMLPTLATDSSYYTTERANILRRYSDSVYSEVQEVVRSSDYCLNNDGTANTTNMISEAGTWIHPSATGHIVIAKALDDILRSVGSANHYLALVQTW